MAEKHPYVPGTGPLNSTIVQLRSAFPPLVTAETLKKLSLAPNNEGYVLQALRFVGILDANGKKTPEGATAFSKVEDSEFQQKFGALVRRAYKDLFDLHGEQAWTLPTPKLIAYFRGTDQTSEITGKRQATTFQVFAAHAGHAEVPAPKPPSKSRSVATAKPKPKVPVREHGLNVAEAQPPDYLPMRATNGKDGKDIGLTVRVEINLPAGADQDTYDRIFKSIKENLLNG